MQVDNSDRRKALIRHRSGMEPFSTVHDSRGRREICAVESARPVFERKRQKVVILVPNHKALRAL
jgi:hypothetical protein